MYLNPFGGIGASTSKKSNQKPQKNAPSQKGAPSKQPAPKDDGQISFSLWGGIAR